MTRHQWWLISNDAVDAVKAALKAAIRLQEELCARDGCLCDVSASGEHADFYRRALHELDAGLNVTDAVPADFIVPAQHRTPD